MKNCKECNKEFEPVHTRGTEQLYCSKPCQGKAAQKRHQQRLIEKLQNEQQSKTINAPRSFTRPTEETPGSDNTLERGGNNITNNGGVVGNTFGQDYLYRYYEAKIDNNGLLLRNEYLQKRVVELESEVDELNSELDEIGEAGNQGMLGNIIQQFEKDPVNSVKFVKSLFESFKSQKSPTSEI
jgi:hypothetical protein